MDFLSASLIEFFRGILNFFVGLYSFGFSTLGNYLIVSLSVMVCYRLVNISLHFLRMGRNKKYTQEKKVYLNGSFVQCTLAGFLWPFTILGYLGMAWGTLFPRTAHMGD